MEQDKLERLKEEAKRLEEEIKSLESNTETNVNKDSEKMSFKDILMCILLIMIVSIPELFMAFGFFLSLT